MASRMKEDERNEKIIRGLLKLPANRRCINCNNLGPQYVCTNFWTFICTNCSGLHREFCHRVKSISMAKFTTQEVNALQEGGNEKAKEIYFKEWDPQRHSFPDSSNIDRLRDFIRHVYVDRRFSGERNTDRPSWAKTDRDETNESRRGDSYLGDSRSPSYDDRYGTGGRNGDRNISYVYGERSPGYDQSDNKRNPRRFEVVDDRVRDDRYGTGNAMRRFEERRLPDIVTKPEGSSPSRQKDVPSPPMVRPVRDILGDDAPQLHVGDTPKSNNAKVPCVTPKSNNTKIPGIPAPTQRTSSSSSFGSSDSNPVQSKSVNLGSLIDFTADPEPPVAAAPQQPIPQQNTSPPSNGGDWASFDSSNLQKAPQAATNTGTLESALSQLSTPAPVPSVHVSTLPNFGVETSPKMQQQPQTSQFPVAGQSAYSPLNAPVAGTQLWGSSAVPNALGPLPNLVGPSSQVASKPPQETSVGISSQPQPTGRKALPEDLFSALYPSAPVPLPGWQRGPHPGMMYGMQYPMGMPQAMPTFPHPSKSMNPFDLGGREPALTHAPTFPSMVPLQGALPHVSGPSPLLRSSSFGNPSPQFVAPQQSPFAPALSQGQYMVQQVPSNMPQLLQNNMVMMGHQGTRGPRSPAAPHGNLGMDQRFSLPSTPNSFSSAGGNPFG